jgi:hypothetical protein
MNEALSSFSFVFIKECRQRVGYGIGIAADFVGQLLKNELKTMPYF